MFAEAFFRSGTSAQWRKILSAAQRDAMLEAHRDEMERFAYVPT